MLIEVQDAVAHPHVQQGGRDAKPLRGGPGRRDTVEQGEVIARLSAAISPLVRDLLVRTVTERRPRRVLDIGCGAGLHLAAMLEAAPDATGIGVDADQSYLGPHILTSGVKRVDNAVFAAFQQSKAGKFPGGKDFVFNLKNGGQDVGKISPKVPKAFVARMNALKPLIISGKIKIPSTL